jgi:hypothetical protein
MFLNDTFELWSLPWHALQRSLAEGVGAEGSRAMRPRERVPGVNPAAGVAANWLSRARALAAGTMRTRT